MCGVLLTLQLSDISHVFTGRLTCALYISCYISMYVVANLYAYACRLNSRGEATYEGPMSVWLSGQYSLLLPAGAILSKQYLWETSQETTPLLQLLRKSPQCVSIAFGLYPLVHKATAPVWIDVPVNLKGHTNTVISSQEASECLKRVAESLPISLDGITLSQHKASRARNHVFW